MPSFDIAKLFSDAKIPATPAHIKKFDLLLDVFLQKNKVINLSAIRDEEGVIQKHFIDSLVLLSYLPKSGRVLDLWTGGGFPGLPLAIIRSDLSFLLLDSVGKKIKCVEEFKDTLELTNVETIWGRAEDISSQKQYAYKFDCVVSRAVAYLPQVIDWALPFLNFGGKLLLLKTPSDEEWQDGQIYAREKKLVLQKHDYELEGVTRQIIVLSFK